MFLITACPIMLFLFLTIWRQVIPFVIMISNTVLHDHTIHFLSLPFSPQHAQKLHPPFSSSCPSFSFCARDHRLSFSSSSWGPNLMAFLLREKWFPFNSYKTTNQYAAQSEQAFEFLHLWICTYQLEVHQAQYTQFTGKLIKTRG